MIGPQEAQTRQLALNLAHDSDKATEEVVARANEYFNFLKGQEDNNE